MSQPRPSNVSLFDDHWAIVRELVFEEYAAVRILSTTIAHVDLDNDVETPDTTVYAVHNAQVRLVSKKFRNFFDMKASELIWRRELDAPYIHGRFVYSSV